MLFLEVGKTYKSLQDKIVKIIDWIECDKGYHYKGDNGVYYYYNGSTDRDFLSKDALVIEGLKVS